MPTCTHALVIASFGITASQHTVYNADTCGLVGQFNYHAGRFFARMDLTLRCLTYGFASPPSPGCRPVVCPNDGFWRTLCALEPQLGITSRSDPEAGTGFKGDDWQPPSVGSDAVGGKVQVRMPRDMRDDSS